jgi:hypothetical protein
MFANDICEGKYVKNDTNVGVFASKLQEITGQYMFKHLNNLIHILLTIPKGAGDVVFN